MLRNSQELYTVLDKGVFAIEPLLENFNHMGFGEVFSLSPLLPPPAYFLKVLKSSLKRSLYSLDRVTEGDHGEAGAGSGRVTLAEIYPMGEGHRFLRSRSIPKWLRASIREFFEPYDAQDTANFNLPDSGVVDIHQFIYTVELATELIKPALDLVLSAEGDTGDVARVVKGVKTSRKGEVADAIETVSSMAEALESPTLLLAAGLLCLHQFIIDREKSIELLEKSLARFETTRDKAVSYGGVKVSAQGIAAMIASSLVSSFPKGHPVWERYGPSLRKLRQFAITAMTKYAGKQLKTPTPESIRSAAYSYYLMANIGYLSPSSNFNEHAAVNLETAAGLLGKMKGNKAHKSIGNLHVLIAYHRLAQIGDDLAINLAILKDAISLFEKAAEFYHETSLETEYSIRYRALMLSRARVEMTEASEAGDLGSYLEERENLAARSSHLATEAGRHTVVGNLQILSHRLFMEASELTRDPERRKKWIADAIEQAGAAGEKALAACARLVLSAAEDEPRRTRHVERAAKDLIDYAADRLTVKDYFNAGNAYLATAEIDSRDRVNNASLAATYLTKDRSENKAASRLVPLIVAGRVAVMPREDSQLFSTAMIFRALQLSERSGRADEILEESLDAMLEKRDVSSLSRCVSRFYKNLDPSKVKNRLSTALELSKSCGWRGFVELMEAYTSLFDPEDWAHEIEAASSELVGASRYMDAFDIEEMAGRTFLAKREYSEAILWLERALAHLSAAAPASDPVRETRCLESLRHCCAAIKDPETAMFYSQELTVLFKTALQSGNPDCLVEMARITVAPLLDHLASHATRARAGKALLQVFGRSMDEIVPALGRFETREAVMEIIRGCGVEDSVRLLDLVGKVPQEVGKLIASGVAAKGLHRTIPAFCRLLGVREYCGEARVALSGMGLAAFDELMNALDTKETRDSALAILTGLGSAAVPGLVARMAVEPVSSSPVSGGAVAGGSVPGPGPSHSGRKTSGGHEIPSLGGTPVGNSALVLSTMGPACLEGLAEAMKDISVPDEVKTVLASIASGFGSSAARLGLDLVARRETRDLGVGMIRSLGHAAVQHLVERLRDDRVRNFVGPLLTEMGPAAIPELIAGLKDEASSHQCAEVLVKLGADSVPPLMKALKDKTLQRHAEDLLVKLAPHALPALIAAIDSPESQALVSPVIARCPREAVPVMAAMIAEGSARRGVRETMAALGDRAAPALVAVLGGLEPGGRTLASQDSGVQTTGPEYRLTAKGRKAIRELLVAMGASAVPSILSGLRELGGREALASVSRPQGQSVSAPKHGSSARTASGVSKEAEATPGQRSGFDDLVEVVRERRELYIQPLVDSLKGGEGRGSEKKGGDHQGPDHHSPESREAAVRALAAIGEEAIPEIVRAMERGKLQDGSRALAAMGQGAVKPCIRLLNDDRLARQGQAVLSELFPMAMPELIELSLTMPTPENGVTRKMVTRGCEVLSALHETSIPAISGRLNDKLRCPDLEEIVVRWPEEAIPRLAARLADSGAQEFVRDLMLRLGSPAIHQLVSALQDSSKRRGAAEILVEFGLKAVPVLIEALETGFQPDLTIEVLHNIGKPAVRTLAERLKGLRAESGGN